VTHITNENKKLRASVQKAKQEVKQSGDELRGMVDRHVNDLLQELEQMESRGEKEAKTMAESQYLAVTAMESIQFYSSELISKGSPCDITREAEGLSDRAGELLQTYNTCEDYQSSEITFESSNFDQLTTDGSNNIVGTLYQGGNKWRRLVTTGKCKLLLRCFQLFGLFSLFLSNFTYLCYGRGGIDDTPVLAILAVFELLVLCAGYPVFSSNIRSICVICFGWWLHCWKHEHIFEEDILMLNLSILSICPFTHFVFILLNWLFRWLLPLLKQVLIASFEDDFWQGVKLVLYVACFIVYLIVVLIAFTALPDSR